METLKEKFDLELQNFSDSLERDGLGWLIDLFRAQDTEIAGLKAERDLLHKFARNMRAMALKWRDGRVSEEILRQCQLIGVAGSLLRESAEPPVEPCKKSGGEE